MVLLNMDQMLRRIDIQEDKKKSNVEKINDIVLTEDKTGYLHVDSYDKSGKGEFDLETSHGLQALVNTCYSLRYMHINHSDRTKMKSKTSGRIAQSWCDNLVDEKYEGFEVLNANGEHLTPTLGFKKFVLSEAVLPFQQDSWNCGIAALYSIMLLSNVIIDKVDLAHKWLPRNRRDLNRRFEVTMPLKESDIILKEPDSQLLNKFRIEIYAFIDACAELTRRHSKDLLDDYNNVLRHCYYRPTLFLDSLDYAFSADSASLVKEEIKNVHGIPVFVDNDKDMLYYAFVLASYNFGIDVGECSNRKRAKEVMKYNLKRFYDTLEKETLFTVQPFAFKNEEQRDDLLKIFKFDDEGDITKRGEDNAYHTISRLINDDKSLEMNGFDPICMCMLFAKFIRQNVVFYKITITQMRESMQHTYVLRKNETEWKFLEGIHSHTFDEVPCQFICWHFSEHEVCRLTLLLDGWPPVDVPDAAMTLLHLRDHTRDTNVIKLRPPPSMATPRTIEKNDSAMKEIQGQSPDKDEGMDSDQHETTEEENEKEMDSDQHDTTEEENEEELVLSELITRRGKNKTPLKKRKRETTKKKSTGGKNFQKQLLKKGSGPPFL